VTLYLDSSAIVKLVLREAGSDALRSMLDETDDAMTATSSLSRVETARAVQRLGEDAVSMALTVLRSFRLLEIDDEILDRAATLLPGTALRSLDAIHVASAESLGARLAGVVTYDRRMIAAAEQIGLPVVSP
jgi:predicted nucleic acid-binding protein